MENPIANLVTAALKKLSKFQGEPRCPKCNLTHLYDSKTVDEVLQKRVTSKIEPNSGTHTLSYCTKLDCLVPREGKKNYRVFGEQVVPVEEEAPAYEHLHRKCRCGYDNLERCVEEKS